MVKSYPLGLLGPRVHFLVGLPMDRNVFPRAWVFDRIGPYASRLSLKHTNFPDASICAFSQSSDAWGPNDGLLALVDHYSTWVIKSWHRETFGWWPGPQFGERAFYRRREFDGREWCGCQSGKRYAVCHQGADLIVNDDVARREFLRDFPTGYESREIPDCVFEAARTNWKKLPSLVQVFSGHC